MDSSLLRIERSWGSSCDTLVRGILTVALVCVRLLKHMSSMTVKLFTAAITSHHPALYLFF
jgi:hypothetical protein